MITSVARFAMKAGREAQALALVAAVEQEAAATQPGTLVYLAHRVLDAGLPGPTLLFYESYLDPDALQAHLDSRSWQALVAGWSECFEGSPASIQLTAVERLAGFVRLPAG